MSSYSILFPGRAGFGSLPRTPCAGHKVTSLVLYADLTGSGKCRLCSPSVVMYSVYASLIMIGLY